MDNGRCRIRGWNDINETKPRIKKQLNDYLHSDECWVLLKDGSVKESVYWETGIGQGSFGFKENLVSHWAYIKPPPLPKGFKNGKDNAY